MVPMVREEAFRAFFGWLSRDTAAHAFADAHFGSVQLFVLWRNDGHVVCRAQSERKRTGCIR